MSIAAFSPRRSAAALLHRRLSAGSFSPPPDPYPTSPPFPPVVDPAAVRRLARDGRFADISALVEPLVSDPRAAHEPFAASLLISYASAGMLDAALALFAALPSPRSALSLNALLSALNLHPRPLCGRVPDLFASLTAAHSIVPDATSYGILAKTHCLAGDSLKALPLLAEMEGKGLKPTTVHYTTIIDSLYKENKPTEADRLWKEMLSKGLAPDVAAYNVRVMHLAHSGTPESVLQLLGKMTAAGLVPNTISYNYLINCYCKHKRFEEAKRVYRGFEEKGCEPNAMTYNNFFYTLCRNKDFNAGLDVCMDGIKRNKVPDFGAMKLLVDGLVKGGRVRMAKRVVSKLRNKFPEKFMGRWKVLEKPLGLSAEVEEVDDNEQSLAA